MGGQRTAASQTSFTASESDVRMTGRLVSGVLGKCFFSRDPERPFDTERHPVGGQRTAASQTSFTASESDVRHSEGVRGGPLQGDFWS